MVESNNFSRFSATFVGSPFEQSKPFILFKSLQPQRQQFEAAYRYYALRHPDWTLRLAAPHIYVYDAVLGLLDVLAFPFSGVNGCAIR